MQRRLDGKKALITGGNSGIGLATAKLFLEQGAQVAITGRNAEALKQAHQDLGGQALTFKCDAGKVGEIQDCMATLRMDARHCVQEVHNYFDNGSRRWENMIRDWKLETASKT